MTDINSRRSIIAIIYLAVVGPCVFILQPGYVQGLVEYIGLSEQQAGLIASYELFGVAGTAVALSFVTHHIPWRPLLYLCCAICAVGNFASIGRTEFELLAGLRFFTGIGSGGLISLTFMLMGLTERADRNFGFLVTWVLIWGAFGLLLMPQAYQLVGMEGVLTVFGLFCASGVFFVRALPNSSEFVALDHLEHIDFHNVTKLIALAAMLCYNTAIGIVWAYLFLVGIESGMGEQDVANALTVSQFLGIAGAFSVVILEMRMGRMGPLQIGILGGAASVYLLLGDLSPGQYWTAVCVFNFLWNVCTPYLLAILSDFDLRGRMTTHGVSMQFLGFAIGPYIAAQLLERGGFDLVNGTAILLFVVSAVLVIPGLRSQHNQRRLAGARAADKV